MKRRKTKAPREPIPAGGTYRALVDLSIRDGDGWLNVKAGGTFTPPATMNVRQNVALGEVEEVTGHE